MTPRLVTALALSAALLTLAVFAVVVHPAVHGVPRAHIAATASGAPSASTTTVGNDRATGKRTLSMIVTNSPTESSNLLLRPQPSGWDTFCWYAGRVSAYLSIVVLPIEAVPNPVGVGLAIGGAIIAMSC